MSKYLISVLLLLGLGTLTTVVIGETNNSSVIEPAQYSSSLVNQAPIPEPELEIKTVEAIVTAYSSRVAETDSTPFITAAGTLVHSGVAAANWLPIGTEIRIPEYFGDQVFVIEDRMHVRNSDKVDVWFPSTSEALRFGKQRARIEIL
jgi:3D (Asp-Asp-Asp) domain-containing protein